MPLVWWIQILLYTVQFTNFVATIVTKSDKDNGQLVHPPMQPSEDQRHLQAKDFKRLSTLSLRRDKSYLSHVPNTSIGQPVAKHETFHDHISQNSHKSNHGRPVQSSDAGPLSRKTCLYNKCSEGHVWMTQTTIFANESNCSPKVELELQSVGQGKDRRPVFTIRGLAVNKFICFNELGKIVTKSRGKSPLCRFQEYINSLYTVYQSEANHTWYLSFDRHGKRSAVSSQLQRRDPMKCRRFLKRSPHPAQLEGSDDYRDSLSSSGFVAELKKFDERVDRSKEYKEYRSLRRHHRSNHRRRHHNNNNNNNDTSSPIIQNIEGTRI